MSKRFTNTEKWKDPWYLDLNSSQRDLWTFVLDTCSNAGVFTAHWPTISFFMKKEVTEESFMAIFHEKLVQLDRSRFFIKGFIQFQCGEVKGNNHPHKAILRELKELGFATYEVTGGKGSEKYVNIQLNLPDSRGSDYPFEGVGGSPKEKEREEEKEKEEEEEREDSEIHEAPSPAKKVIDFWNSKEIIRHDRITKAFLVEIQKAMKKKKLSPDKAIQTIENYARVVKSHETWWDHKWPLKIFLKREKSEVFWPENFVWENYLKDEFRGRCSEKYSDEDMERVLKMAQGGRAHAG